MIGTAVQYSRSLCALTFSLLTDVALDRISAVQLSTNRQVAVIETKAS